MPEAVDALKDDTHQIPRRTCDRIRQHVQIAHVCVMQCILQGEAMQIENTPSTAQRVLLFFVQDESGPIRCYSSIHRSFKILEIFGSSCGRVQIYRIFSESGPSNT